MFVFSQKESVTTGVITLKNYSFTDKSTFKDFPI